MMLAFACTFAIVLAVSCTAAENPFTTYNQTKRLPAGCVDGYTAGTDTVLYTVPYTSGNPDDTVTLNGTDNTIGTARTYDKAGAHVIETLTLYMKPAAGPYAEIHTLAPLTIPSLNLSFYADYDANFAGPVCNRAATLFNETINFCATNATQAAVVLHQDHLTDVSTVGKFLGGQNFTSCAALSNSTSTNSTSNATSTNSAALSTVTSSPSASSNQTSGTVISIRPSSSATATSTQSSPAPGTSTSSVSSKGGASGLMGSAVIAGLVALAAVFL